MKQKHRTLLKTAAVFNQCHKMYWRHLKEVFLIIHLNRDKMKIIYITCIVFLFFLSCAPSSKNDLDFPIIDIEKGLGNFQVFKLSEFASSIRYVRLETHEDCLVTNRIHNIYLEDNKIFVLDDEPYLKVFDAETGKYLYNIGSKGQGPGELPYLYSVDINPYENNILLCWGNFLHRFDFDGNFLGKTEPPLIDDNKRINAPVISIGAGHFAGTIQSYGDQNDLVILFNDNQEITGSLQCYENPIQPPNIPGGVWSPFDQGGLFYRVNRGIRYFRGFTDTVYAYKSEAQMFFPFFIIDYGKYKSTLNFTRDAENPNLIKVSSIKENNRSVFLDFHTQNASPQPYEDEVYINGTLYKFINHSISGIFDKQKQSFHFLLQPIPGIPGLVNDLDKGIPFFVRNVSTDDRLIGYHHAYKFLEYVESLPNPNTSFTEIVNKISEDDNPIVIIAK